MIAYEFEIKDEITPLLEGLSKRLAHLREPLEKAAILMYQSINQNFNSRGRPASWTPNAPSTIHRKGHGRILEDSGALRRSVTSRNQHSIYRLGENQIEIGTNLPYAAVHQFGRGQLNVTQNVRSHQRQTRSGQTTVRAHTRNAVLPALPARPFLVFQDEDKAKITEIFKNYLRGVK